MPGLAGLPCEAPAVKGNPHGYNRAPWNVPPLQLPNIWAHGALCPTNHGHCQWWAHLVRVMDYRQVHEFQPVAGNMATCLNAHMVNSHHWRAAEWDQSQEGARASSGPGRY